MNEIKGKSLQLLVIRAQKGDDTAFSELFHSTCKQQYHYARTLMKDSFLAEDIVQEVYIKLYKNIGQLREPGAFLGYLYRMTYNESMRYLHKKYLDLETTVEQDFLNTFETTQSVPETALLSDEKSTLLAEGLKTLSEEERFALMMHYCENMTINEIEEALNLSRSTVRRRINSAKEKMACYLSDREMRGLLFAPALLTKTEETALLDTILAQKEPFKEQKKHSLKSKIVLLCTVFVVAIALLLVPAIINSLFTSPQPKPGANTPEASTITPSPVTPPAILNFDLDDTVITLYLKAGDLPIDFETIYALASDGTKVSPIAVNPQANTVTFAIPTAPITLHVSDTAGNMSTSPIVKDE